MKKVFKRVAEPSSWTGLAALAVLFGFDHEKANVVVQGAGALSAMAAVLLPEARGLLVKAGD